VSCRRLDRLPELDAPLGEWRVAVAHGPVARLLGLALLDEPPQGRALLIPNCRSVHTFGMRFALDLLFVDGRGRLVRLDRGVPVRRVRGCRAAHAVLEAPAGAGDGLAAGLEA
jgi:uncharacterized protein